MARKKTQLWKKVAVALIPQPAVTKGEANHFETRSECSENELVILRWAPFSVGNIHLRREQSPVDPCLDLHDPGSFGNEFFRSPD
ncbi:hypothetical protein TNCV_2636411 [Trichonephila clavipes]|uniref:Uncharacterized protein n=1 Tax=Trichonephila clavipes TaxID=2585209 RepID=A0A8X6UPA8_TRICX|nr:hypothetical protein TNCV_2636411 [Trichonephila clavipes]